MLIIHSIHPEYIGGQALLTWDINEWKQQENDFENKDVKELQEKIEILGNRLVFRGQAP